MIDTFLRATPVATAWTVSELVVASLGSDLAAERLRSAADDRTERDDTASFDFDFFRLGGLARRDLLDPVNMGPGLPRVKILRLKLRKFRERPSEASGTVFARRPPAADYRRQGGRGRPVQGTGGWAAPWSPASSSRRSTRRRRRACPGVMRSTSGPRAIASDGAEKEDERRAALEPEGRGGEERPLEAVAAAVPEDPARRPTALPVGLLVVADLLVEEALDELGALQQAEDRPLLSRPARHRGDSGQH